MGGGTQKGKRKGGHRPKVSYRVVSQSYEDKDYEDGPKPVLIPAGILERKKRKPVLEFDNSAIPEDFTDKRNMLMANDMDEEEEERMFGDEVEEDFDQDWIQQMITGEGVEDEEVEEEEELDEDERAAKRKASKHETAEFGAKERMFARMLRDFNMDEDIDEEDPRVQGPLQVEAYAEALEQFAEDHAGTTWMDEGAPSRHKGLINQLKAMSRQNNVFDSNTQGLFYAVASDKGARIAKEFKKEHQELIDLTKKQLKEGVIDTEDVLYKDDAEIAAADGEEEVEVKAHKDDRMDCETVLSSYSTLYNRPNIIAAEKGKLRLKRPRHPSTDDLQAKAATAAKAEAQSGENDDEEAEEEGQLDFEALREELSHRPKKETPEEKKARRALFKKLQAERRQQKKDVKGAYQEVFGQEAASRKTSKTAKAQTQLSLVPGLARKY